MNTVLELTKELAHYGNDVNLKMNEITTFTNELLLKNNHSLLDFVAFTESILSKLPTEEQDKLAEFATSIVKSNGGVIEILKMNIEMTNWNTLKLNVYVENYERLVGL